MKQSIRIIENKAVCLLVNIYLLAGVTAMLYTMFFLLFHLNNSDKIIYLCIPGFIAGISSILLYSLLNVNKSKIRRRING